MFLSTEKVRILIDAGLSGCKIAGALSKIGENPKNINAILITHEHSDHIKGAGIFSRKYSIPIYANQKTWASMDESIGVIKNEHRVIIDDKSFEIGDIAIEPFTIPHDAADPMAYSITAKGKKVTIATDMGHITEKIKSCMKGSDLILIESNHDIEMLKVGRYPWLLKKRILGDNGHLSNESAAELVTEMAQYGTKRFFLGHLSKENNFPELAYQTTKNALHSKGICVGKDILMSVASRDNFSEVVVL